MTGYVMLFQLRKSYLCLLNTYFCLIAPSIMLISSGEGKYLFSQPTETS